MSHQWKLAIATQTPLVRVGAPADAAHPAGDGAAMADPAVGGFTMNPGGVSRMVFDTVRRWFHDGHVGRADWFSLQPQGERTVSVPGMPLQLHHLALSPEELQAYARTKDKLWSHIHGAPGSSFNVDDFRFYSRYNWFTADSILQGVPDLDAAYVHDFQLLQTGAMLGLAAPSVLRWHVPFDPHIIPPYTRNFLVRLMEDFDALIVSTQRDQRGLIAAGYRGSVHQIYPHINPNEWPLPTSTKVKEFQDSIHLGADDPMVLCVARMDPMKSQDVAIRAMSSVRRRHPRARLVLVGNGSFSNTRGAGLGLSKADQWSQTLTALVTELGLEDAVTFAHWIPDSELSAAYARADLVILPSQVEGFGITVLEAWRYKKPCIVSSGAGAAEIIQDGHNSWVFSGGDVEELARAMTTALSNRSQLEFVGAAAFEGLGRYAVPRSAPRVSQVLEEAIDRFGTAAPPKTDVEEASKPA